MPNPDLSGEREDPESADIDALFERLRNAQSARAARRVENAIARAWTATGSDTADLLVAWASEAAESEDYALALRYLDTALALAPSHAEAWNRRAGVHYRRRDLASSLADLRMALSLEPRHFAALAGLGLILSDIGREREALDAFRRARAVHPHMRDLDERIDELRVRVEGRDI